MTATSSHYQDRAGVQHTAGGPYYQQLTPSHVILPSLSGPLPRHGLPDFPQRFDLIGEHSLPPPPPPPVLQAPTWEGPPNEEARKRDEEAENVKTNDQAMVLFEHLTKFIDENPESAEAASNALDAILRTRPTAPEMDDSTVAPSLNFGDFRPMSPSHPIGQDIFGDFIDYSAIDDAPTPDLVAGPSTNPSPESVPDQDHPHTGRAGSPPQTSNAKTNDAYDLLRPTVWREIAGGDAMFHQVQGWKWEGSLDAPDPEWAISP